MLWVNLIMDVLGAIALGTEHPKEDGDSRISRKDGIINPVMWRQIICMGIYQTIIMVIFMFFGQFMLFKKSFSLETAPLRD
jgi:Ca2+-transporting ATPase